MNSSTAENFMRSDHEQQHRRELHALGERADDQAGCDARERHLERCVQILGNVDALAEGRRGGEIAARVEHPGEEQPVEPAEEVVAGGEREAVAIDCPQHREQAEGHEDLHRYRQHVLRSHHARVEERESGHCHEDDQERRRQHPCDVALVERRCGWRRCCRVLRERGPGADEQERPEHDCHCQTSFHCRSPTKS
jgi:hypothetical protein